MIAMLERVENSIITMVTQHKALLPSNSDTCTVYNVLQSWENRKGWRL